MRLRVVFALLALLVASEPAAGECRLSLDARSVRIAGTGAAVLTVREAFSAGAASSVELPYSGAYQFSGAMRETAPAPIRLEPPGSLTPVNMSVGEYDVQYSYDPAARKLTVRVERGGEDGHIFGGAMYAQGGRRDTNRAWYIQLAYPYEVSSTLLVASSWPSATLPLSGTFEKGPTTMEIIGGVGRLDCLSKDLHGQTLRWTSGAITLVEPIALHDGRLRVVAITAAPPIVDAGRRSTANGWIVLGVVLLVAVGVAGTAAVWRRARRAALIARSASTQEDERPTTYDVFLCYHRDDAEAVRKIALALKSAGVRPWLDEWELRPGSVWLDELDAIMSGVRCAAVFIGPNGVGPFEKIEIRALVRAFVERSVRIVPVILEGVTTEPRWLKFLDDFQRVDFRNKAPDPLQRLVWGVEARGAERVRESGHALQDGGVACP
jgi:hypothetical protein